MPIGARHTWRSVAYLGRAGQHETAMPTQVAAPVMRSGLSPWNTWRKPWPAPPTSASGPSGTSSKCSVNCFSGSIRFTGSTLACNPGASVGTMNRDSSASPRWSVPVRATTSSASASSTPEM